jgi:hypothetical protein
MRMLKMVQILNKLITQNNFDTNFKRNLPNAFLKILYYI